MIKRKIQVQRSDDADAFIRESEQKSGTRDDLAQHLAEEYLRAAASGEESEQDSRDELLVEEFGGPFIESRPEVEFGDTMGRRADDPDEEKNALPQAVGALAVASADEEMEAVETTAEQGDDDDLALDPDAERASSLAQDIHDLPSTRHLT